MLKGYLHYFFLFNLHYFDLVSYSSGQERDRSRSNSLSRNARILGHEGDRSGSNSSANASSFGGEANAGDRSRSNSSAKSGKKVPTGIAGDSTDEER